MAKPHFIALLSFLAADNGGLKIPVMSGFRAFLAFPFYNGQLLAMLNFIDTENAFAADVISAEITLTNTDQLDRLYQGLDFDFYLADHIIGHGVITKVMADDSRAAR